MKRIKAEEIQNSIQNHIKHRNICTYKSFLSQIDVKPSVQSSLSNIIDMNLMALNDLSLIESTINDYYAFSLNSAWNSSELFSQFESLKNNLLNENIKIEKGNKELILFAMFVYISIDITLIGVEEHKTFINKNIDNLRNNLQLDQEQEILLESLKIFADTKNLSKSEIINKWHENKCRIKISEREWKEFINFLNNNKLHLLIGIININFQIVFDFNDLELDEEENVDSKYKILDDVKCEKIDIDYETSPNNINPKNLFECFKKIHSQPSRINGACYFYTDDFNNELTSSSFSPNLEYLSYSTENSVVNLFKLNEDLKLTNNKFYKNQIKLVSGHSGVVFKSKFTHDSKYLISCGEDGYSYLWKINDDVSQYPICAYSAHTYPVWDVETFSMLNLFSTCSKDGKACLWSFDRLYPLRVYCGHHSDVNCVKFHPNGVYLATGSNDKTVRLWSVQTSEFVRLFSGHRSRIFSLAFSPDGNYLASAGEDRKIKIWDLRTGGVLKELKGHTDIVHSLAFDNKSEILCSGGLDKTIKFWDLHQKGINLDPGKLIVKSPSNSNELIRSITLNCNVYSIITDVQNTFYVSGARKPKIEKPVNTSPPVTKPSPKIVKEEKKIFNERKLTPEQKPINNQTQSGSVVMSTRRRSAITTIQTSTPPQQPRAATFNFNLNNDDLYEV
ncbi:unnamed protein product [Brachionus calyciflorus]|uniref:TFIID subunit TAF5 NTD2 domain-containing protein n=1 Tax=Brachionus calyciflorus TaxID=104777 RepID=A0A813M399_9BILA|nr:unnamed protein product [Brachionus calyciflorus]